MTEHLDGMKTVKSYGAQERNVARFTNLNERLLQDFAGWVRNMTNIQGLLNVGALFILAGALSVLIDVLHVPGASALVLLRLLF